MKKLLKGISTRKLIIVSLIVVGFFVLTKVLFKPVKDRGISKNINPKRVSVSSKLVSNKERILSCDYYGQIINSGTPLIISEVNGLYNEHRDIRVGEKVRRGEKLGYVYNPAIVDDFEEKQNSFDLRLSSLGLSVETDFPQYTSLWSAYVEETRDAKKYYFPEFGDDRFQNFLENEGLRSQINGMNKSKKAVSDQTIIAEQSGVISKVYIRDGSQVSRGKVLYELSLSKGYEVSVSLRKEHLDFLVKNKVYTFLKDGEKLKAVFISHNPKLNSNTYTVGCLFKLLDSGIDVFSGEYLKIALEIPVCESCDIIPSNAIDKNNNVFLVEDGVIVKKEVNVIHTDLDYSFYSGLSDSTIVIDRYTNARYLGRKVELR